MHTDFVSEIVFKTSRSGGKGGQNVNKVETAVTGFWLLAQSTFFDDDQKALLAEKLRNRMNAGGELIVKSQVHRSQGANKAEVIEKFADLVTRALEKKKPRIASRQPKAVVQRRLDNKRQRSLIKQGRSKQVWQG